MRIAQLAPPFESVPPAGYGGTERVIHTLVEELVRRGHDVTLFASGDSKTSARLIPTNDQAVWHHQPRYRDLTPFWSVVVGKALREVDRFDMVHSHLDHFGFSLARQAGVPVVTTLHGRLDLPELQPVFGEFTDVPLVSISDAQRTPVPRANFVATIHHGIELEQFTFDSGSGNYLAFLGRVSPEKGLDTAIRVARKAGWPLKVAARMPLPFCEDPNVRADWEYWDQVIQPLLGNDVEIVGEVSGAGKDAFLRDAAALLFPIRWPEPFGLVMIEALACGTPVLALRQGSVPEVIRDGVTGFVRETEDELVEAIGHLGTIDRVACRREVEARFSPGVMVDAYEQVFERLATSSASSPRIFDFGPIPNAVGHPMVAHSVSSVLIQDIRDRRKTPGAHKTPQCTDEGPANPASQAAISCSGMLRSMAVLREISCGRLKAI
jgi:glycosyltransferase involved in cell wall biosynthesis